MISMLFPRRESCSRLGRLSRCLTADNEVISLCSSFKALIVSEMGVESVDIWFAETDSEASDGN